MAKEDAGLKSKKKKKWCQIIAPKSMNEMVLGETRILLSSQMVGKTLTQNLMNLTGDMKKQNVNLTFKVTEVKGDTAYAEPIAYELVPTSVKRLVRRGRDRIDDSFLAITKDDKVVRIKPLVLAKTNTVDSKLKAIRKELRVFLKPHIRRHNYENLFFDLIDYRFQNAIKADLKKIYPMKNCEIRAFKIEKIREEEFEKMKLYVAPPEAAPKPKKEVKKEVAPQETQEEQPKAS